MEERDFDVLIQYVPLTRIPFGLYVMLHSSQNVNGTSDYSGIVDQDLDSSLETLWSGVDEAKCISAALKAQARLSELLPCTPVLTPKIMSAISEEWVGAVALPGIGADNIWSYLGLHKNGQPYGGTLTSSIIGNLTTLNPCIADSTNEWGILQLIYSPLLYVDPVSGEDTPMLAESWPTEAWTSPQGSVGMKVTFKLRNNVLWQDGVPFTAHDIKFCVDYLKENDVPRYRSICTNIEKVETPDDTTVIIYLNEPGYRLLYSLNWLTFMPEHIWGNVSNPSNFKPWTQANPTMRGLTMLVGTGPFVFVPGDINVGVTLGANPSYFMRNPAKPGLIHRQQPKSSLTRGEVFNVDYLVNGFTGSPLSDPAAGFTYKVTAANNTVVDDGGLSLNGGLYRAQVETSKLSLGSYVFSFDALPYGSDSLSFTVSQPSATTGGIKVMVLDAGGKPIVGASVSSTVTPSGQKSISGVTVSDGSVMFNDVQAGSYTFQASLSGYVTNTGSTMVVVGGVASSSIILQSQSSGGASSGGVPGYGYEAIVLGIILSILVMSFLPRKQKNT
jgi:hypothetical protein